MAEQDIKTELPLKKKKPTISGVDKAAILLLVIGEQDAAEVMKHMGPKEVQSLGSAMANLATFHVTWCVVYWRSSAIL